MTNSNRSTNIDIVIARLIEQTLLHALEKSQQIVLLLGARQVGKTTVLLSLKKTLEQQKGKIVYLNCDLEENLTQINTTSLTRLKALTKNADGLFIDETQRLTNPGLTLKIIHDEIPKIKVLATGSSSLDLKNRLSDPLTGRVTDFTLYPLSFSEIVTDKNNMKYLLPSFLNFGFYPSVQSKTTFEEKTKVISGIIDGYLFKDILEFQKIRQPNILKELVQALAYQVGSEVNENELANRLKINRGTVVNYLDLLEKTFVIVKIYPFSHNPRREIGRNYKVYFLDLGVRNGIIGDFISPEIRQNIGHLWENFLVIERLKKYANLGQKVEAKFWRNYGGAEVDYIERKFHEKNIRAYEFKYSEGKIKRGAKSFENEYKTKVSLINPKNFQNFIY